MTEGKFRSETGQTILKKEWRRGSRERERNTREDGKVSRDAIGGGSDE